MLWERLLAVAFAGNQCNKIHCVGSQKNLSRKGLNAIGYAIGGVASREPPSQVSAGPK